MVSLARRRELTLLAETTEHRHGRDWLDTLYAVVTGLRTEICAPSRPMPPQRARNLLQAHTDRSGTP